MLFIGYHAVLFGEQIKTKTSVVLENLSNNSDIIELIA